MFYNSRWYDPMLGRFAQADTIVPGTESQLALDRYAYGINNPIKFVDPSGHSAGAFDGTPPWEIVGIEPEIWFRQNRTSREQLFLDSSYPPLRVDDANYRNFGDNRGAWEKDSLCPSCDRFHLSIDAGYSFGDEVHPIAAGTVLFSGWSNDLGNYVIVEHYVYGEYYYSVYAHLGENQKNNGIYVSPGDVVRPSTIIGSTGNTKGSSCRDGGCKLDPHLHFEVRTALNINQVGATPFSNRMFWGYRNEDKWQWNWQDYFLDLGYIYGYDTDYP